jgi:hypothetical protein
MISVDLCGTTLINAARNTMMIVHILMLFTNSLCWSETRSCIVLLPAGRLTACCFLVNVSLSHKMNCNFVIIILSGVESCALFLNVLCQLFVCLHKPLFPVGLYALIDFGILLFPTFSYRLFPIGFSILYIFFG